MFHTYIYFKQINIFHNLSILFERHEKQFLIIIILHMEKDLFSYNNKNANINNKNVNILEEINTHNIYLWIYSIKCSISRKLGAMIC